jgi:hypothetical protein
MIEKQHNRSDCNEVEIPRYKEILAVFPPPASFTLVKFLLYTCCYCSIHFV